MTERTAAGYAAALRHPVAVRLLSAKLVSEIGDFVGLTALVLLAYQTTDSVLGSALVLAARSLPALLVAGALGPWLDQPPRRTALVALHLAGAVIIGIPAVAPNVVTAVAASALLGAARSAFRSVQAALIAESVDKAVRLPLFGLASAVNQASQVIGVVAGASLTLTVGVRPALVMDLVSFVVAAAILALLPVTIRTRRPDRATATAGVRIILGDPTLRWVGLATLGSVFSASLAEALAPAIADQSWVPAVMAAPAAGGMVFTLLIARTSVLSAVRNQVRIAAGMGLALALTGLAVLHGSSEVVYVAGNAAIGAGLGWLVGAQVTFANLAPPERMGQVEATMVAANILTGGVGVLLLGALAEFTGPAAAYLAGGLLLLSCCAVARRRLHQP